MTVTAPTARGLAVEQQAPPIGLFCGRERSSSAPAGPLRSEKSVPASTNNRVALRMEPLAVLVLDIQDPSKRDWPRSTKARKEHGNFGFVFFVLSCKHSSPRSAANARLPTEFGRAVRGEADLHRLLRVEDARRGFAVVEEHATQLVDFRLERMVRRIGRIRHLARIRMPARPERSVAAASRTSGTGEADSSALRSTGASSHCTRSCRSVARSPISSTRNVYGCMKSSSWLRGRARGARASCWRQSRWETRSRR